MDKSEWEYIKHFLKGQQKQLETNNKLLKDILEAERLRNKADNNVQTYLIERYKILEENKNEDH